ncbi:MAG: GNAT family N-acetyltransferase, partial [Clostridia bacterium]|nr:GNAT family N-acetyltransferase [Clostridia bacterium]
VKAITDYGMKTLGLNRVCLRTNLDNSRAIHVYEKCGFREFRRTDEQVCMDILK